MKAVFSAAAILVTLGHATALSIGPQATRCTRCPQPRIASPLMKKWEKRQTLADTMGGASDTGFDAVGLEGTIPVVFTQGNDTMQTMASQGQKLSAVAAQAGQYIKYKCGKGECGTCEVRVDGQWIRTCTAKVPYMPKGESYEVYVRPTMTKTKKSSRFFSFRSFIAGAKNNILGMIGFVREGRKSKNQFKERIQREDDITAMVAARKAAKAAAETQDE
mmetsp:Transcript_5514/g.14573  ORF Transcript_5514/g.14573 Transcript_5514/m.14573 type:complete len:219 (-) Transcript_5514:139-795(-)